MTGDRSSAARAAPCLPPPCSRIHGAMTPARPSRLHPQQVPVPSSSPATPARRTNASCCSPERSCARLRHGSGNATLMGGVAPAGLDCQVCAPPRRTQQGLLLRSPRRARQPHEQLCGRVADHDGGHDHEDTNQRPPPAGMCPGSWAPPATASRSGPAVHPSWPPDPPLPWRRPAVALPRLHGEATTPWSMALYSH